MYRSISTQAIVIRRERIGEFHKSLALLTADLGLITATAYGAYKSHSRLRLGSEPFTWSAVHLYHNPVRKSYKVTDLEIRASFEGLQADLDGWLREYNEQRPHSGKYCYGKTPMQTFLDALPMTREKMIGYEKTA